MPPSTITISSSPQIELAERSKSFEPGRLLHARIVVLPGAVERGQAEQRGEHRPGMTPAMNNCATEADSTRLPSGSIATLPPVATA